VTPAVGTSVRDCTPPAGLAMSGFAARTGPAVGTHDPLTVRALAVDDTVLITVDACGLHEDFCARVRAELPAPVVVVAATHTHGGPVTMPGRLGGPADTGYGETLHAACVAAAREALASREPASVEVGVGPDPGIARNRRRADGPVHAPLSVVRFRRGNGTCLASLVSYPCHPVVLGADNRYWTADYPGVVRTVMEEAEPGSVCLFLTGCCGELNTGHGAHDSMSVGAAARRSFAEADRIGRRMAEAALEVPMRAVAGSGTAGVSGEVPLPLRAAAPAGTAALVARWERELPQADAGRRALLHNWLAWAHEVAPREPSAWTARVTVLRWAGLRLVALPGEPFSATAREIAARVPGDRIVIGYCDGCPGYFPPAEEFAHGGYEVEEAHRYYGMPAPFAPGTAETLAEAAVALAGGV
jgi:neutral ceramidase